MTFHISWTAHNPKVTVPKLIAHHHQHKAQATQDLYTKQSFGAPTLNLGKDIVVRVSVHVPPALGKPAGFVLVTAANEEVVKTAVSAWPDVHCDIVEVLTDAEVVPILEAMVAADAV